MVSVGVSLNVIEKDIENIATAESRSDEPFYRHFQAVD